MYGKNFIKKINKLGLAVLSLVTLMSILQVSSPFATPPKQENLGNNNNLNKLNKIDSSRTHTIEEKNIYGAKYELDHSKMEAKLVEVTSWYMYLINSGSYNSKLVIPDDVLFEEKSYKVVEIKSKAFENVNLENMDYIVIGYHVRKIGRRVFENIREDCTVGFAGTYEREIEIEDKILERIRLCTFPERYELCRYSRFQVMDNIKNYRAEFEDNRIRIIKVYKESGVVYRVNEEEGTATVIELEGYKQHRIADCIVGYRVTRIEDNVLSEWFNWKDRQTILLNQGHGAELELGNNLEIFKEGLQQWNGIRCSDENVKMKIEGSVVKFTKDRYTFDSVVYEVDREKEEASVVGHSPIGGKQITIHDFVKVGDKEYPVKEICGRAFWDIGSNVYIKFCGDHGKKISLGNNALGNAKVCGRNEDFEVVKEDNILTIVKNYSTFEKYGRYKLNHDDHTATLVEHECDKKEREIIIYNSFNIEIGGKQEKYIITGIGDRVFADLGENTCIKFCGDHGKKISLGNNALGNAKVCGRNEDFEVVKENNILTIVKNYATFEKYGRYKLNHDDHTATLIEYKGDQEAKEIVVYNGLNIEVGGKQEKYIITGIGDRVFADLGENTCIKFCGDHGRKISLGNNALGKAKVCSRNEDLEVVKENNILALVINYVTFEKDGKYKLNHDDHTATLIEYNGYKTAKEIIIYNGFEVGINNKEIYIITGIGAGVFADLGENTCIKFCGDHGKKISLGNNALGKAKVCGFDEDFEVKIRDNVAKIKQRYLTEDDIRYKLNHKKQTAKVVKCIDKTINTVCICDSINFEEKDYKVEEIEDKAFEDCKEIELILIGENVDRIGKEAFADVNEDCEIILYHSAESKIEFGENALGKIKNINSENEELEVKIGKCYIGVENKK